MAKEPDRLSTVAGVKQVRRALSGGRAKRLLLARDADPQLTQALAEQAMAQGVETVWFGSRKELGHACGITVGAAAAAELLTAPQFFPVLANNPRMIR